MGTKGTLGILNPPEGFIATANKQVVDSDYPFYVTDLWEPPYRVMRIREMIEAREKHGLDDMAIMQMDVVALQAREFIRNVLSAEEGVVSARLQVSALETRAFTLDVQLIRALGGGFNAA